MAKTQLKVATIVASSTDTAWSQTYHAGGVTAVVSVKRKETEGQSLSIVGKDLLNTFESEYFTLETKNLASIKSAVEVTFNKSKDAYDISFLVAAVIQNAVYVVLAGNGKIQLIRSNTLATLLEEHAGEEVLSASGFLENQDVLILETHAFSQKVPSSTLLDTLSANSIEDSAEILSPALHNEADGSAAALLLSYHEAEEKKDMPLEQILPTEKLPASEELPEPRDAEEPQDRPIYAPTPREKRKPIVLTHRQKLFLTIIVALVVVFVGAIYFSLQKKQTNQDDALFASVFPPAQQKFQEGESLKELNATLAQEDFTQAQQMLAAAKGKFPAGSADEKQITDLLAKIHAELTPTNTAPSTPLIKVDASTSPLLAFALAHASVKYIAADSTNFYFADSTGITKVPTSGGNGTQIIKNGGDWKTLGGFATYLGNMYVLDTTDGIDKYAVTSGGFGDKTAYFSTTPDLSKAVSIAIDGSIWILQSNGTITSYTKGTQDSFTITGLATPLSAPSELVTTVDDANIYVLDNGNSRLVILKKNGTFVNAYSNSLFKTATQIDVNESGKKAYILSGGNVYELDLK